MGEICVSDVFWLVSPPFLCCRDHRGCWAAVLMFEFSVTQSANHPDLIFMFCRTVSWQVWEKKIRLVTNICSTWLRCTWASDVENGVRCCPEVTNRCASWSSLLAELFSLAAPGAHGGTERKRRTTGPDWGARCPWKKGVANTNVLPLFILPPHRPPRPHPHL